MDLSRTKRLRKIIGFNVLILFFVSSCSQLDNQSLGENLSIWEGDKKEDRAIVYCEGNCRGGIYVIPSYDRHYDSSGRYAEYLIDAKSNADWVIAKTFMIKHDRRNYWIINKEFNINNLDCEKANCDSIIQSKIIGPLDYQTLKEKNKALNINLTLEH
ncbi:hypothetical protein [Pedobacter frigoris]|uniref:Lipoprotein n=1 Tax=Pedobacter frigoris TaxID=2571272 RepID=A0A4U1CTL6_9SPHI|nr:hypothetical protein [Pedobacter frigoris]TKC09088.1 hypothetical protein FA047_03050 [Pedobacter frigoris]